MQRLVRDANQVRWENPALRSRSLDICHRDADNEVLAFRRWNDEGNVVLTIVNCSDREWRALDYRVCTGSGGGWTEIFNSKAPLHGGHENSVNGPGRADGDAGGGSSTELPAAAATLLSQSCA